jgi:tetratricopeptide (TPR) repeat protein
VLMDESSEFEDRAFEDEIQPVLNRFLSMQSEGKEVFFDVSEYEDLFDYFIERGEWKQAQGVLQQAVNQHPESQSFTLREVQLLMATGKSNRALKLLNAAEKLEPFNDEVLLLKAQLYSQIRKHEQALIYYQKALDSSHLNRIEILFEMAMEWYELKEYENGVAVLAELLVIQPDHDIALHEISHHYEAWGRIEAGIDFLKEFVTTHPFSAAAWFNLGELYMHSSHNSKALEAFDFATAINPSYGHSYFNKGMIFANLEQYKAAIQSFKESMKHDERNPLTLCYIGECYEKLEKYEQALDYYNQVLELDENWSDAWMGKSVVYEEFEEYTKAISMIKRALKILPEHITYLLQLAELYHKSGDSLQSKETYEKCVQSGPDFNEVWISYAEFIEQTEGVHEAINLMMEGMAYHEGDAEFYYRIAAFLFQAGNESHGLLFLGEALLENYDLHYRLFEHFPPAENNKTINHLISIYNSSS